MTQDQFVPDSVIRRVQKLLALAAEGSGATEAEASLAAERVQSILAEYNLDLAQVGEGATPSADVERIKDDGSIAAAKDWEVSLMGSLAENNFCKHWAARKWARRANGTGKFRERRFHILIGRRANVVTTIQTYEYLVATMERLCPYQDGRDRSTISWFSGCTDRLASRLSELRAAQEAESRAKRAEPSRGSGTDLVLADVHSSEADLNNDLAFGYAPGTTAARRMKREAEWRAMEEARRANPSPPVVAEPARVETEAQRLKREAKEARANERWRESYYRRQAKEAARVDQAAYRQGSEAGRDIGLDRQVAAGKPPERLG